MNDDDRLREEFQASRAVERTRVPAFTRVKAGHARANRRRRWLLPAIVAASAVVAVVIVGTRTRTGSETDRTIAIAREVMAWRSSTDFLLPASSGLLTSIPRIGEATEGSPLQSLDPGSLLGPPILPRSPRS